MKPCKVVAELGCIHLGDLDRAISLVKLAHIAEADYVKFQKRNPIECVPKELQNLPHPNQMFAYGKTYLEHRQKLELSITQHRRIYDFCNSIGTKYSTSVWDITSAREVINEINPDFIKIPSACNNHRGLLDVVFREYKGDVHISTGMTTGDEMDSMFTLITEEYKCPERVVIYHCTSEYPCKFENLHLLEITRLLERCQPVGMRVGFSNHGYGIASDVAAYMLGAEWIERHFVDDRTLKHTDAAASLETDGMKKLCRDLKNVKSALTFRTGFSDNELEQRQKLKFRG